VADLKAEASVVRSVPPPLTSRGSSSARGEVDPHPVATRQRVGDFHGGGTVEPEAATWRTQLRRKPSSVAIVGSNYCNSRGDRISL
jgi:hypothetical protein